CGADPVRRRVGARPAAHRTALQAAWQQLALQFRLSVLSARRQSRMSQSCQRGNPLLRGGTDQPGRQLAALDPGHFQVDERSLADFILFARRYARNVRFPGEDAPAGASWEPFFDQDLSVSLATLASLPLRRFLDFKNALRRFLTQGETLD